jgi:hypothetical protein
VRARGAQLRFDEIIKPKPDPAHLPLVEKAKAIRALLRENFPDQKFRVKSDRYVLAVNVYWTDGPSNNRVEALVAPFKRVRYDDAEVICARDITSEGLEKVKRKVRDKFAEGTFGEWNRDPKFRDFVEKEIVETDL